MTHTTIRPSEEATAPATSGARGALPAAGGPREWIRRPLVACLLLLAIYATCTLALNDPRGTLGTDTGGKLATLHVMDRTGSLVPEVGYWAAKSDPHADLHPLYYTFRVQGHWVNVTTLPMIYAAYPLFELGGDRAVLLLPMLGSILCALAARALARRLGRGSGWSAFWLTGLVSPVAIYALDFWEHSLGLAAMMWAVFWLLEMIDEPRPMRSALIAGLLFGAAATMRTEALVYLVACGGVACAMCWRRSGRLGSAATRAAALLTGAAVVLLANDRLERLTFGETIRASRAAGTAAGAGTSLSTRITEALTTLLGVNRFEPSLDHILGALIVVFFVVGITSLCKHQDAIPPLASASFAAVGFFYLMRFGIGLGFVPGLLTASPLAALGVVLGWRKDVRVITVMAVVSLPLVWAFQYSGGAGPQWGGRYILLSGALLLVAAAVVLEGKRRAMIAAAVVAGTVTTFGIAWLSVRSAGVASGFEQIVARHDQAVISGEGHVLREGGAFYEPARHWLTTTNAEQLRRAVSILRRSGDTEFAYLVSDTRSVPAEIGGFQRVAVARVSLHSVLDLKVATYRLG
jgi:hypothetical protein